MKEIGQKLKLKREENGVSLEEAASDLKMRVSQLESIEEGKKEDFKDVFSLKYFIRDYAKYLGLRYEDIVDEFNEYLFDYTSKLSLDDIKKAKKKDSKKEEARISSPYTLEPKEPYHISPLIFIMLGIALVLVVGLFIINRNEDNNEDHIIALVE